MYQQGETVIYPHHGACIVEGIVFLDKLGAKTEYLILRTTEHDMKVSLPADRADELGLRRPIAGDELDDLVALLQRTDVHVPSNWSRRLKNHQEKLRSGDVYQVAEVVRNLALRKQTKELSNAEREMFEHARTNLVNELAPSLGVSADEASAFLDEVFSSAAPAADDSPAGAPAPAQV